MSKYTPGPWTAYDRGIGWEVHDSGEVPVNDGFRETFTEADARLIAAAPELLEACRVVTRFLDGLEDPIDDPALTEIRRRVHAPLRAALNPAIAKAEGKS